MKESSQILKHIFREAIPVSFAFLVAEYGYSMTQEQDWLFVAESPHSRIVMEFDRGRFGAWLERIETDQSQKSGNKVTQRAIGIVVIARCFGHRFDREIDFIPKTEAIRKTIDMNAQLLKQYCRPMRLCFQIGLLYLVLVTACTSSPAITSLTQVPPAAMMTIVPTEIPEPTPTTHSEPRLTPTVAPTERAIFELVVKQLCPVQPDVSLGQLGLSSSSHLLVSLSNDKTRTTWSLLGDDQVLRPFHHITQWITDQVMIVFDRQSGDLGPTTTSRLDPFTQEMTQIDQVYLEGNVYAFSPDAQQVIYLNGDPLYSWRLHDYKTGETRRIFPWASGRTPSPTRQTTAFVYDGYLLRSTL